MTSITYTPSIEVFEDVNDLPAGSIIQTCINLGDEDPEHTVDFIRLYDRQAWVSLPYGHYITDDEMRYKPNSSNFISWKVIRIGIPEKKD